MKMEIDIPENELFFIDVPDITKKYKVVNYGYAGSWLMESNSTELNAWKTKIPDGKYNVIGATKKIFNDNKSKNYKNFVLRKIL